MTIFIFLILSLGSLISQSHAWYIRSDDNYGKTYGGEVVADPNNPKFYQLAERLVDENPDIDRRDVTKITVEKVTKQVVRGEMIRMDFTVRLANEATLDCNSKVWLLPSHDIDTGENIKIMKNTCYAYGFKPNRNQDGSSHKRVDQISQSAARFAIESDKNYGNTDKAGGEREADTSDPKFFQLAKRLVDENPDLDRRDVKKITVVRVTTQVVQGEMIRMGYAVRLTNKESLYCNSKVWLLPYYNIDTGENIKIMTNGCYGKGFKPLKNQEDNSDKRDDQISQSDENTDKIGGETKADPSDPKFYQLAKRLVDENPDIDRRDVKEITVQKVTTQVVRGEMIRMDFTVRLAIKQTLVCNAKVWLLPYDNIVTGENIKIMTNACYARGGINPLPNQEDSSDKRVGQLSQSEGNTYKLGGETEADSSDPKFYQLAKRLVDANPDIDRRDVKKITVERVTTQVVKGEMIRMDYAVRLANMATLYCNSKVWLLPYYNLDTGENIEIKTNACYARGFKPLTIRNQEDDLDKRVDKVRLLIFSI